MGVNDELGESSLDKLFVPFSAVLLSSISPYGKAETGSEQTELKGKQQQEEMTVYGRQNSLILNSGTATKSDMELMEIPASVIVIDKEPLEQQGINDFQGAIRNISGLNQAGNNYGIGDNLVIRGLGVKYVTDGMYSGSSLGNSYNPSRSLTNVESIEVLKGPATGLYGIGAAGGVINFIEKSPQFEEAYEIKTSLGSWDAYQLYFDATGPLSDNVAYRLVANRKDTDGYRGLGAERSEVYGSLLFETSSDHALTLSGAYIDDSIQIDSVGDPVRILNHSDVNGSPQDWRNLVNGTGSSALQLTEEQRQELADSISSSTGYRPFDLGDGSLISPLSSPNEGKELRLKLKSEWQVNNNTFLTQHLLYRDYESRFIRQTGAFNYIYWDRNGVINSPPRAPLVIDDVLYPYAARRQEYRRQYSDEKAWQYFGDLQVDWNWGSVSGEHLFSANYENRDFRIQSWSIYDADGGGSLPFILDIRNPNWPTGSFDDYNPTLRTNYKKSVESYGVSFQEVVYLGEKLTGRVGAAYTKTKQTYEQLETSRNSATPEADTDDKGFTYNVGLNYRVITELAVFANYAQGRTAYSILGSVSNDQDDNRPDSESKSVDFGIRFTAFDQDLLGSIVWFDTRRTNLRYSNPLYNDNINSSDYNVDVPQYFYDDEDKTTGVEFDLNFALSNAFTMNMNATYQDAVLIRKSGTPQEGPVKGIPDWFASAWGEYSTPLEGLPGDFSFGLGATYEAERSVDSIFFGLPDAKVGSYTVWDSSLAYEYDGMRIQMNINNIFDKRYYSKAMFLGGLPGNERNIKLTASYQF